MIRVIIVIMLIAPTSAHAGWKMYAPGNPEPIVSSTDDPNAPPPTAYEVIESTPATSQAAQKRTEPEDNFDLSGVEWRRMRGYYSGRASKEMTKKFGYRAGTYRLEYEYKARRYFGIWMHTRRGMSKLLVNRVGRADTHVDVVLPKDDEVWFEVESPFGNWEFTFEKIR